MSAHLSDLLVALRHLAWSSVEQTRYLEELGVSPSADELALEFDDAFQLAREEIDDASLDALLGLDTQLNSMSGEQNANLWDVAALAEAPAWATVRAKAADALKILEQGPQQSNSA